MEIGQQLLEARRRQNLTLQDISRRTKIPVHLLQAIECNDFDRLPAGFFTRAFVRAYAKEVGVSPAEFLDGFEQVAPDHLETEPSISASGDHRIRARSLFLLLALGVGFSIFGLVIYGSGAARAVRPAPQQTFVVKKTRVADPVEVVAPTTAAPNGVVRFAIESLGTCMLSITADGRPVISQLVRAGEPVTVAARGEIILRVGDTGKCATPPDTSPTLAILPNRRPPPRAPRQAVATRGLPDATMHAEDEAVPLAVQPAPVTDIILSTQP